jgi:hypothetical protein
MVLPKSEVMDILPKKAYPPWWGWTWYDDFAARENVHRRTKKGTKPGKEGDKREALTPTELAKLPTDLSLRDDCSKMVFNFKMAQAFKFYDKNRHAAGEDTQTTFLSHVMEYYKRRPSRSADKDGENQKMDQWTYNVTELIQETLRQEEGVPEFLARVVLSVAAAPRPATWMDRISSSLRIQPSSDINRVLGRFADKLEEIPSHVRPLLDMDHLVLELLKRFPDRYSEAKHQASREIRKRQEQGAALSWPVVSDVIQQAARDYPPAPPALRPKPPPEGEEERKPTYPGQQRPTGEGDANFRRGREHRLKKIRAPPPPPPVEKLTLDTQSSGPPSPPSQEEEDKGLTDVETHPPTDQEDLNL